MELNTLLTLNEVLVDKGITYPRSSAFLHPSTLVITIAWKSNEEIKLFRKIISEGGKHNFSSNGHSLDSLLGWGRSLLTPQVPSSQDFGVKKSENKTGRTPILRDRADPRAREYLKKKKLRGDSGRQPCPFSYPGLSLSQAKLNFDFVMK
ncbi:hypothetical protein TNCV_2676701 [Trichonephila clavipes]|nr:hypothetical protein TNCV_2676701 [Trichonephila clavipes]